MATEVKSFWKTLYVDECWAWKFAVLLFIHVAFAAKILRGPRTGGRNSSVLQQENNQLAHCLAQNEVSFKLAYLCDIFAEVNKLHVSMQGPYKTMLDVSNKIAAFNEKLSLWKRDITSGVSRGERGNNCPGAEWLREARKSPNNVTTRRATRGGTFEAFAPPKIPQHCIPILTYAETFKESVACRRGANGAPAPGIQGRGTSKEWNYKTLNVAIGLVFLLYVYQ